MPVHIYSVLFHCMIQFIKIHLELAQIQDMGEKINSLYLYQLINLTRRKKFFSKYYHDIDFLQQFDKQEVN